MIWITEVWDSEASHKASLNLPQVRAAINQAMPMIPTAPVGGVGLPKETTEGAPLIPLTDAVA